MRSTVKDIISGILTAIALIGILTLLGLGILAAREHERRRDGRNDRCEVEFRDDVAALRRAARDGVPADELGRAVGALRATLTICIPPGDRPHPSNLLVDLDAPATPARAAELARALDEGWAATPPGKPWAGAVP